MDRQHFIEACRAGGRRLEEALRVLHRDYAGALARDAFRSLGHVDEARDLVQDTLIKAWQKCASFGGTSEIYAWLKQVLRNGAIDRLRQRRPEVSLDSDDSQDDSSATWAEVEVALRASAAGDAFEPLTELEQRERDAVFRRCAAAFAAADPQAAAVLRWIVDDELTPAQIAELIGRSPGATREYLSQCRKKARRHFQDWYALLRRERQELAP
jgi:RNA polymerase sigma-70 factor (ECF subfamily)